MSNDRNYLLERNNISSVRDARLTSEFFETILKQYPEGLLIMSCNEEVCFATKTFLNILGFMR